jgi:hypothetical protein
MVREHMAQLRSRRRNRKRMDYVKGRAMIGKFEMGKSSRRPAHQRINRLLTHLK